MRRIFLILLLILPITSAQFLYYNPSSDKYAVFVSRYTSPSMDSDTINYYQRLKNDFSVYIIPDNWVVEDRLEWRNALNKSSLVFVTSLNENVLGSSRNSFCQHLASTLSSKRGLVFAGNSSYYDGSIYGCIQKPYFNISEPMNNTRLSENKVKITDNTGIAFGYDKKEYNLGVSDTIYVINTTSGKSYGTAYGDPDGEGNLTTGNYAFLSTWNALSYRILFWGVKTSLLGSCATCLGWTLFDQSIDWVSNASDMGFKITTDKAIYKQGELITVTLEASANLTSPSGKIFYPNGIDQSLFFEGTGKKRTAFYILEDDAPSGNYLVKASDSGVEANASISVKMFDISIRVGNSTKEVEIEVEVKKDGSLYNNLNITLAVYSPSKKKDTFTFENQGFALQIYNVTESGEHVIVLDAISGNIKENATQNFTYTLPTEPPEITLRPENVTLTVYEAGEIPDLFVVAKNIGGSNVTNITLQKEGDISEWISFYDNTLPDIGVGTSQMIRFNISVPQVDVGAYTGAIKIVSDQTVLTIPIRINFEKGEVEGVGVTINPTFISETLAVGEQKSIKVKITNSGDEELTVTSMSLEGSVSELVQISGEPSKLVPSIPVEITLNVQSPSYLPSLSQSYYGDLVVDTDKKKFTFPSFILIKVVEDLSAKVDDFSDDVSRLEDEINDLKRSKDVSDLEQSLDEIKDNIQEVKRLYSNKEYALAISTYNSISGDIDSLERAIEEKKGEGDGGGKNYIIYIIVAVVVIAVGVFLFKKLKGSKGSKQDKYAMLYSKWGRRPR